MVITRKSSPNTDADWEPVSSDNMFRKRGIWLDIGGVEGTGKTSLALTLIETGKVGYVDIDQSIDRALKPQGKMLDRLRALPVRYSAGLSKEMIKENCGEAWDKAEKRVASAIHDWASGIILDTATEAWELKRLASFGELNPKGRRMDRIYGPVNAQFRQLLRSIYRGSGKHLVTVSQYRDEYIDKIKDGEAQSVRTGKLVRAGFKEIGYLCDLAIRCFEEGGELKAVIEVCKLPPNGPALKGMPLEGDQLNFAEIIGLVTETDPDEWRK